MKKFLGYLFIIAAFFCSIILLIKGYSEQPYTDYQYDYEIRETVAYHWNLVDVVSCIDNKVTIEYNGNLYSYNATKPVTEKKVWVAFINNTDIIVDAHKNQTIN